MDVDGLHTFRTGYVAIVGRPNVGKSTLINHLLQFKLAITTPKPQTTRHRIMGILTGDGYQIIFLDTPGLIDPDYRMQEVMMRAAQRAMADADIVLLIVEASETISARDEQIIKDLQQGGGKLILAINKIDLLEKAKLLPLMDAFQQLCRFVAIIPICARTGENTDALLSQLVEVLPVGAPFYNEDEVTQHPERFFVSELIREKIFTHYGEEIPYSTAVVIDEFKENKGRKDYIKARIVVEKQSQKGIIIGKKGLALRRVGQEARAEIEQFLGRPVFLELWVAVREKWRKKDIHLREFGYE
ncbi:GTPase Era [candidate division KSB1 bacterium]|nr:GTPase Era [candidate division KSB1 bacterium]